MKRFNTFYFESFSFDKQTLLAQFQYSFDRDEFFTECVDFSSHLGVRKDLDDSLIQSLLFHCHIALGISYYKAFPAKNLKVLSGNLDGVQIKFWKKFYMNGLGEFLIKNDIKPDGLFQFESDSCADFPKQNIDVKHEALLPWGGGKDSIVSSILLEEKIDFMPYVFGKIDSIKSETLKVLGKKALLTRRKISDNLFTLNNAGYYNGHVPITGIIAFISIVTAYLYNHKYVILSNEGSADEPNTLWEGIEINHQYSKSLEFEKDFDNYLSEYITEDIKYFSLLRGFSEYKIAEIFANDAGEYFSCFASCNKNFIITGEKKHRGSWCSRCEKCAFVFLILSAFLPIHTLEEIFGENLFEVAELESTFASLIGYNNEKPFECVGTYEESIYSMYLAIQKITSSKLPYILQKFCDVITWEIAKKGPEKIKQKLVTISDDDIIPHEIKKLIF